MSRISLQAVVLLLMLAATTCQGQGAERLEGRPQFDLMKRTYKVVTPKGTGTAFVVGQEANGDAKLITAEHVVEGSGDCELLGLDADHEPRTWRGVKVAVIDKWRDLALLIGPAELADRGAVVIGDDRQTRASEQLLLGGFGGGLFANTKVEFTSFASTSPSGGLRLLLATRGSRPGSSGAAVINRRSLLVGVAIRGGDDRSVMVAASEVKAFLKRAEELRRTQMN